MPGISAVAAAVLAVFVMGLGIGYGAAHEQVKVLNAVIAKQADEAKEKLEAAINRVNEAQDKAKSFNNELDKAHEAYIETANNYDQQLDAIRLYPDSRRSCSSPATASHSAGVSEDAASEAELSAELDRLVKEKARIADEAADYADKAYQFAAVNNCGLIRSPETP